MKKAVYWLSQCKWNGYYEKFDSLDDLFDFADDHDIEDYDILYDWQ